MGRPGGLMVGALLGLVIGAVLVIRLSVRVQWVGAGIAAAIASLTFGELVLTAPQREAPSPAPVVDQAFQPFFRVGLRVSHTQEILAAVSPDARPVPFVEVQVSTSKPELVRVGWGPGFQRCEATPSAADLEALVPRVREALTAAGPFCRTPEDDLGLAVTLTLGGESGNQGLHTGCLADRPDLRALVDALRALADRLCVGARSRASISRRNRWLPHNAWQRNGTWRTMYTSGWPTRSIPAWRRAPYDEAFSQARWRGIRRPVTVGSAALRWDPASSPA